MENPYRVIPSGYGEVEICNKGIAVAHLKDVREQRYLFLDGPKLKGCLWYVQKLEWLHAGAMQFLQGRFISHILGEDRWILLQAKHRPHWHPQPGADDAVLFEVHDNPACLSSAQICRRLYENGF